MFVFLYKGTEAQSAKSPYEQDWINLIDKTATKALNDAYYYLKGVNSDAAASLKNGYFAMRKKGIGAKEAGEYSLGFLYSKASARGSTATANNTTLQQKFNFNEKEIAAIGKLGERLKKSSHFAGEMKKYENENGENSAVSYMLVSLGSNEAGDSFALFNKIRASVLQDELGIDSAKNLVDKIRGKTDWKI